MLNIERLKEVLSYEPETGIFIWLIATNKVKIGDIVGSDHSNGYLQTSIDGKKYFLHRLAWLYMTGKWPDFEIDHKDTNKINNKWNNLREATRINNTQNVRVKKISSTQYKNVYWEARRNKYRVSIRANGKRNFIGYYNMIEDAVKAANNFMVDNHKEFANIK